MKCPYCGDEMESGFIKSGRSIYWGKEQVVDPLFYPDDIKVNKFSLGALFGGNYVEAYHCSSCKKIVVSYE